MIRIITSQELKRLKEIEYNANVMCNHALVRFDENKSPMENKQLYNNLCWVLNSGDRL